MLEIEDPSGPYTLLDSLESVEAPDPQTVTMKLKQGRRRRGRSILTHNVATIVPDEIYPREREAARRRGRRLRPVHAGALHAQPAGGVQEEPELQRRQRGPDRELHRLSTSRTRRRSSSRSRTVRSTSPTAASRRPTSRTCATTGPARASASSTARARRSATSSSTSRRSRCKEKAIRQAVAQVIDRDAIVNSIYKGTATPLLLDGPVRVPGRQGVLQGEVRRSRSGQGQGPPRRGRRLDPGRARRLVHPDPLRAGRGRPLERAQAPARREPPVHGQPRLDRVGPVQGRGLRQGHVLLLRARLVPGLSGRGQLPRAVHARRRVLRERLLQQGGQRRARRRARLPTTPPRARRRSAPSRTSRPRTRR